MKKFRISIIFGLMLISSILKAQTIKTESTPNQMVDALHNTFGKHPNARAVHAKGIIVEGYFEASEKAKAITKAIQFQNKKTPVTVRFSDFTGIPNIPDTIGASNPRGLAIKFLLPKGVTTDIVTHSYNGFPVSNTDEFVELLNAIAKSGANAQKPTALEQFFGTHPIAKTFLTTQKPATTSFGTISYYGVNSYKFTNVKGESKFIRYQFIPEDGEQFLNKEQIAKSSPDYLYDEIKNHLKNKPVKFKLYAQIAKTEDNIANPSIAWPETRERILLGTITITKIGKNTPDADKQLHFIPNNVTEGIETADPMLEDRSKAYPISIKERQ
ncbi:catalase [Flavobacterium sp. 90]|uniref:catalase family peroxidase n=1 Tax=unclassified Flavobacterium TaxID=196869 RepID=UPI000EB27C4D|nr:MULTISPECIES: catalase family peroxidase [unclassified Flavobacterium]RKR08953.1 catalase [Flavobacterium sp. 81]TCK52741.1 catalase [Flavobacterium sp. 90]